MSFLSFRKIDSCLSGCALLWYFLRRYFILLTTLVREKNAKVKEILKVLGIEPILNNLAHAIR